MWRLVILLVTVLLAIQTIASPLDGSQLSTRLHKQRAINGIFGGFETTTTSHSDSSTTSHSDASGTGTSKSVDILKTLEGATKTSSGSSTSSTSTQSTGAPPKSYSIIGTAPPVPTPTPEPTQPTRDESPPTSTVSNIHPTSTMAAAATSTGASEWKIIGVAVIAFSAVAAILLLAVFFDQWWRFMRDLCGWKKKRDDLEEVVPDWEKAGWEIRLAQDSHRYPSFSADPALDLGDMTGIGTVKRDLELKREASVKRAHDEWRRDAERRNPVTSAAVGRHNALLGAAGLTPPGLHSSRHYEERRRPHDPPSPALTNVYGGIEEG